MQSTPHPTIQPNNTGSFLADLTELSNRYGIGISGQPVLFILEQEDRQFAYRIDGESNLSLG